MNKPSSSLRIANLLVLLATLLGFLRMSAQGPSITFDAKSTPHSSWRVSASKTADLKVGDVVTLNFTGKPEANWHLYSSRKDGEIAYNPTELFLFADEGSKGIALSGGMKENKAAHEEEDELMGGIVRHWENGEEVVFSQNVKITGTDINAIGELAFQCCMSDGQCIRGQGKFTWKTTAKAADAGTPPAVIDTPVTVPSETLAVTPKDTDTTAHGDGGAANTSSGANLKQWPCDMEFKQYSAPAASCDFMSLLGIFGAAFLGGLIAIFTPCVFPTVPMTVSFFTKQSKTRAKGIRNALTYSGFIIFIYTVLGLALTAIFGSNFLYEFSTSPITNVVFFIMLVVFALSFFGWFEIALPAKWSTKLDAKADRGGFIGIFFMALVLVVVSFSCTGPILGAILIQASSSAGQCFWQPVAGMLGFSVALSIPFGLLAIFPGWMNSLPKSGGWLNVVKVVLGFLELAFAMKFLSAADLVAEWGILERDTFLGIWVVIFVLLGVYLLGKIRLPHDSPTEKVAVPKLMLAIFSFSFALYLVPGMFGKTLPILEGVIPPITGNIGVNVRNACHEDCGTSGDICDIKDRRWLAEFAEQEHEFCWFYDMCEAADYAQRVGKPLFVDFTGHSCANCRKMETTVFTDASIAERMREDFVIASMWVDDRTKLETPLTAADGTKMRTVGDLWLNFEKEIISQNAQPYYVIFDVKDNKAEVIVEPVGYTPDVSDFKDYLDNGIKTHKMRHAGDEAAK
jgi:thiol:disulfide interchange protein DsbD